MRPLICIRPTAGIKCADCIYNKLHESYKEAVCTAVPDKNGDVYFTKKEEKKEEE